MLTSLYLREVLGGMNLIRENTAPELFLIKLIEQREMFQEYL